MRISIQVKGDQRVVSALQGKEAAAIAEAAEVVSSAASQILTDTQAIMPVVTGALRDSGKTAVENTGTEIDGYIGFGDSSTNPNTGRSTASYAVEKHEDPIRGKFLENTLYEYAPTYIEQLTKALHKIF